MNHYIFTDFPIATEVKVRQRILMQDELGFQYSKGHVYGNGSIFWRCSKKDKKCKASITTMGNRIIRTKNEHNHFGIIMKPELVDQTTYHSEYEQH